MFLHVVKEYATLPELQCWLHSKLHSIHLLACLNLLACIKDRLRHMAAGLGIDACPSCYGLLWKCKVSVLDKLQRPVLAALEALVLKDCAVVLQKQSQAVCRPF